MFHVVNYLSVFLFRLYLDWTKKDVVCARFQTLGFLNNSIILNFVIFAVITQNFWLFHS